MSCCPGSDLCPEGAPQLPQSLAKPGQRHGLRFRRPHSDEAGHVGCDRAVAVAVLVEARNHETGRYLAADLILQGVTELQWLSPSICRLNLSSLRLVGSA